MRVGGAGGFSETYSEEEREDGRGLDGVRWGPKLPSHPFFEKAHSANSPQLYNFGCFFVKLRRGIVVNLNINGYLEM